MNNDAFINGLLDEMEKNAASISAQFPGKIPRGRLGRILGLLSPSVSARTQAAQALKAARKADRTLAGVSQISGVGPVKGPSSRFISQIQRETLNDPRISKLMRQVALTKLLVGGGMLGAGAVGAGLVGHRLLKKKKE